MAAGKYDIVIDQGSGFGLDLVVQESGSAKDLSSYSVRGQIRPTVTSDTLTASFVGTVTEASQGKINVALTPSTTAAMSAGKYFYDVEVHTTGDSVVTRLLQGTATVSPEVTR
jgi:hypothetical protein